MADSLSIVFYGLCHQERVLFFEKFAAWNYIIGNESSSFFPFSSKLSKLSRTTGFQYESQNILF